MSPYDLPPRMAAKVAIDHVGCWLWTGAISSNGYGSVGYDGRIHSTHRLAYRLLVGEVSDGLTLDHLCRRRNCLNPQHLEPVSASTNVRRAYAMRTTCNHGHDYSEANTYLTTRGTRECRTCRAERQRERRKQAA